MSYRVKPAAHVETLRDGRMVGPGDVVSDADAKRNPQLVERGVLLREHDKHKRGDEVAHDPAEREKEESK